VQRRFGFEPIGEAPHRFRLARRCAIRDTRASKSPAPLGGGLVKAEWFKRCVQKDRLERFDRIVQSWDTANGATELNDFSVCTSWGVKGKDLLLIGLFRRRVEYPALSAPCASSRQHLGNIIDRKATSQPHQFAVTIAVRVGDWPTAQKSEPIGKW
jgi:phage terminase large subunit-like protein